MRYGKDTENGYKNIPGIFLGNRTPLVRAFPDCKVIFTKGYHYVSGFVGFPNGNWVYFASGDDRWGEMNYLVRTAKDEKDFTGASNHFTKDNKKEGLIELIRKLSTVPHMPR
jgi:hypothetical protein